MRTGVFRTKESFAKEFKVRLKKTYLKDLKKSTIRERYNILLFYGIFDGSFDHQ